MIRDIMQGNKCNKPASTSPSISIHFLNGPGSHNAARIVERAKSLPRCPIAWQHFLGTNLHHSKATRTAKGSTAIHGVPPLLSGSWFHVDRVSCQLHGECSTFTCHLSTFACSRSSSIIVKPVLKMSTVQKVKCALFLQMQLIWSCRMTRKKMGCISWNRS